MNRALRGFVTVAGSEDARPPRILLVDDDSALRAVVAETLRGEGYEVDETTDGSEALDRLHADRPDLILLDLAMAGMDGETFIERCRASEEARNIPVVIVSATPSLPEAPQEVGVRAVLVKPFDLGVLVAMVDRFARATGTE